MTWIRLISGTVLVLMALSYGLGLNLFRTFVDAQDAAPEAAQFAGLDVIDAADADFTLLGGPVQRAFDPDTDEQLVMPLNVVVAAVEGETAFLVTDPLAQTVPTIAGETYAIRCPQEAGAPDCTRHDGRTFAAVAESSHVGPELGSFLRNPQLIDLTGDGALDLVYRTPSGEIMVEILGGTSAQAGGLVLVLLALSVLFWIFTDVFDVLDLFFFGGPFRSSMIQAAQAGLLVESTIWEPGEERDFDAALFADALPGVEGLAFILGRSAGRLGEGAIGGAVEVLHRPGGPGAAFSSTPITTVRSADPDFGSAIAVHTGPGTGFCGTSCVAVGAPSVSGGSSVWLIDDVASLGPDEQISEAQPWAARISGIPNGHRGLALELADVNLDGALDLLIGVPGGDSADVQVAQLGPSDEAGVVYVGEGPFRTGALADLAVRAYVGGAPGDLFGGDLAVAELNGDSLPDLLVTARFHKPGPFDPTTGALFGFFGTSEQVARRTVDLRPGLNLVGWTGDTAVPDATASIAGLFSQILGWDAATQAYVSYIPGLPAAVQGVTDLNTGDAFWIVMDQAATWEQPVFSGPRAVSLLAGLNLAMWTGPAMAIEDALAGLDAADAVFRWNGVGYDTWRRGAPVGNTLETLANGDAFFIRLAAAATWEQPAR